MTEETLFAAALDKATPAERAAFLDEACAGDVAMRRRVEALMASHEHSQFLRTPAVQQVAAQQAAEHRTDTAPTHGVASALEDTISLAFLAPSEKPDSLGSLGHYEVQEVIGKGGMGIVLKAFDEKLHRVVAIKVMAPALATSGTARRRFVREAQAAAAIRNDHVINIHAVEENNEPPYLVMEYIEGQSLQEWLDRTGPLELKEILRIGQQTAAGLAAAHAHGVIHRDIKPANILLENGVQRVKITDFGLARAVDDASLTQSGVVAGTPQYMSPEQARGEVTDHRTDLFSLGSVLYAMCTGRPPFRALGTLAVLRRVEEDCPRPIPEIRPEIPPWLVEIVDKLLAKNPSQRFGSAAELAELLGQYLAHLQQPASMPRPPGLAAHISHVEPAPGRTPRRGWVAVAMVAVAAGVVLAEFSGVTSIIATLFSRQDRAEPNVAKPDKGVAEPDPKEKKPFRPVSPLVLEGHGAGVYSLAFSPDGKTLATGSVDQRVRFWHTGSGALENAFSPDPGLITGVAFCLDGQALATTSNLGNVELWESSSLRPMAAAACEKPQLAVVVLPKRGMLATAALDGAVTLWSYDGTNLDAKHTWQARSGVFGLSVAPDESSLAAGSWDGKLFVWDLATLGERSVQAHSSVIRAAAFSPDGKKLVTAGYDKLIKVWEVESLEKPLVLRGHREAIYSLAFSPAGLLVSAGGDWSEKTRESTKPAEVKLWDVNARKELASLALPVGCVFCARFSPDGNTLATAHSDKTARLWDVETILAQGDGSAGEPMKGQPFVILREGGKSTASFASLSEAVEVAVGDDTIEIRGNGPFVTDPMVISGRSLCIRAAKGFRPVIKLSDKGVQDDQPIVKTNSALVLEGLEFHRIGKGPSLKALVLSQGAPLHVANCRFVVRLNNGIGIWGDKSPVLEVRNCAFHGSRGSLGWVSPKDGTLSVDNCVLVATSGVSVLHAQQVQKAGVRLTRNTIVADHAVVLDIHSVPDFFGSGSKPEAKRFEVTTQDNVFDVAQCTFCATQVAAAWKDKPVPPLQFKELVTNLVDWRDLGNLHALKTPFMTSLRQGNPYETLVGPDDTKEWQLFAGSAEAGSLRGKAQYAGGNLRIKAAAAGPASPDQFKLLPESPGHRAGKDGKDLGADVDLVGPGAAYERWQTTSEYQVWLKNTGQVKK